MSQPLVIGVTDLLRHPGSRREVRREVPLPGIGISTAVVPEGALVDVDLVVESMADSVVVSGEVRAPWEGACRRCLEPVADVGLVDVREIFERSPVEGETYPLDGDLVDLEPMVRDAVLLSLPLAPLCSEGCKGPAPQEFPATVEGESAAVGGPDDTPADPNVDPRWAALGELTFEHDDADG